MTLLRAVARPMLASMFMYGGADTFRNAESKSVAAQESADLIAKTTGRHIEPADLVRVTGAVQVVAGAALATGRFPRLAALTLAGTLGPVTVAGHRFWNESEPSARRQKMVHFLKNTSMAGGLLMATLDPEPKKRMLGRRTKDKSAKGKGKAAKKRDKRRN